MTISYHSSRKLLNKSEIADWQSNGEDTKLDLKNSFWQQRIFDSDFWRPVVARRAAVAAWMRGGELIPRPLEIVTFLRDAIDSA